MLLRVLVASDQRPLAERVVGIVANFDVLTRTVPLSRALERIHGDGYDLVLLAGQEFGTLDGSLQALQALSELPELLVLTHAHGSEMEATALSYGVRGLLSLDLDDGELRTALEAVVERVHATRQALAQREHERSVEPPDAFIVESPAMVALVARARRAANSMSTVLVMGETGVGKERVAQLVHDESPRSGGPFIALNCAAIPSELMESELFGHERGAFTGANRARRGFFELAHGGTLFLDEIGELPLSAQAKLLRVLQDRQLRPLGSDKLIDVDVRLIAATNQVLEAEVEAARFRSDLYYRLRVIELEIPPLRERSEDIARLLEAQLERFNGVLGRSLSGYSDAAMKALLAYRWPGNVRELINVVERAALLCEGPLVEPGDLPVSIAAGAASDSRAAQLTRGGGTPQGDSAPSWGVRLDRPWREVREALLREGERAYLVGLLQATGGRIGATATRAGLAERSLFEKMKRHGLRKEDFRRRGDPEPS